MTLSAIIKQIRAGVRVKGAIHFTMKSQFITLRTWMNSFDARVEGKFNTLLPTSNPSFVPVSFAGGHEGILMEEWTNHLRRGGKVVGWKVAMNAHNQGCKSPYLLSSRT